jgi:integrase
MAHLEDRWHDRDRQPTELFGKGKRWRVRYRDPSGRDRSKSFERKDDALRYAHDVEMRIDRGRYIDPDRARATVGELAEQWLATKAAIRKPTTSAGYESLWNSVLEPRWADVPVSAIAHSDVAKWVGQLSTKFSPSRTRQAHLVFRALLDMAVKDRRIEVNPALGVDLPSLPMKGRHQYLTPGQVKALAEASGDYASLILTLGFCGLRWGEAIALQVQDVDVLRRRIHIRRNLSEVHGKMVDSTPKTNAVRWVPMPAPVFDAVEPLLDGRAPNDLLFTTPGGYVIRHGNFVKHSFAPASSSVGLVGLKIHSLRHTAASIAVAAGASVKDVQRMLGHARASMTLDVYADLFEDDLDDLARRIGEAASASTWTPPTKLSGRTQDAPERDEGVFGGMGGD